jgi:DNA primase
MMEETAEPQSAPGEASEASREALVNDPLPAEFLARFEAKLEPFHPYFEERGLTPSIVSTFGLAYFPETAKGMMKGRMVIPIHNERGEPIAYGGRWVGPESSLPEGEGKYKLPPRFHKQLFLYNLHRVQGKKHLVLVEGFFSVFRLYALGVPAVALMGCSISDAQIALLRQSEMRFLTVLLDGDDTGRAAVPAMMERLAKEPFPVKFALLPEGSQPDTVPEEFLRKLLQI